MTADAHDSAKICIDCKHCWERSPMGDTYTCMRPSVDVVRGTAPLHDSCYLERSRNWNEPGHCGPEGKHWTKREHVEPKLLPEALV